MKIRKVIAAAFRDLAFAFNAAVIIGLALLTLWLARMFRDSP